MTYTEHAVLFPCDECTLIGIVTAPRLPSEIAVVVIVGGPQYRAGSHRQFVLLARRLAEASYPVIRFDCRGMGDSSGVPCSFESTSADIAAAIDAVRQQVPQARRIVLWGLCDGASAALLYVHETGDERVCGVCLANPWVRSELSLARTHVKHYYTRRLMQREFWFKLFRGRVGNEAVAAVLRNLLIALRGQPSSTASRAQFQQRMVAGWRRLQGSVLLLLSGEDYTAKEFAEYAAAEPSWMEVLSSPRLTRGDLPAADHTFSRSTDRRRAEDLTLAWLATLRRVEDAAPKGSSQHR